MVELETFTHHVSDYISAAKRTGLECVELRELFDDEVRPAVPRILALLFKKNDPDEVV